MKQSELIAKIFEDEELFREFKRYAKYHGYAVFKYDPVPHKLPCKCGATRAETWIGGPADSSGYIFKCPQCGRKVGPYKDKKSLIKAWNFEMESQ